MARAAAWFETGEEPDEGEALRWFECQDGDPELCLPSRESVFERSPYPAYVKIHGHEAPKRVSMNLDGDFRVAGKTPTEVDQEMLQLLIR